MFCVQLLSGRNSILVGFVSQPGHFKCAQLVFCSPSQDQLNQSWCCLRGCEIG